MVGRECGSACSASLSSQGLEEDFRGRFGHMQFLSHVRTLGLTLELRLLREASGIVSV